MATPSLLFAPPGSPSAPLGPQLALPAVAGGQAKSLFPNSAGALPAPQTTVLKKDPVTGMFTAQPDAPADVSGDTSGGAPAPDPYATFLQALTGMLSKAQSVNADSQKKLGGAKDFLTTESVNGGAPKPFDPTVFSDSQVGNQEKLEKGFDPAITSLNTQMENENKNLGNITDIASKMAELYHPQVLSAGQSLVSPDGTVVRGGHSYTPTLNTMTGLMDGFDQNTGTWASDDKKGIPTKTGGVTTPQTLLSSGIIAGIDLSGAAVGMKPYATDPNYVQEVGGLYSRIQNSQALPTSEGLDAVIKGMAKSSPITGAMIMNAAATYKIDPNLLAAVLGHESDFGTQGAATSTMNPGNVGNTGTATQAFKSWTQGVNGAAAALAKRIVGPNITTPTATGTESKVGGPFSPEASKKVSQLPAAYQSYVDAGPLGVAYINDNHVPAIVKDGLQTLASRAGIPYVGDADVSALQSIQTVFTNIDGMQKIIDTSLHPGVLGALADISKTGFHAATFGNAYPDLSRFNSFRDTAIKTVQALAGGAGSGLRINMGEIEANLQNLPTSTDNSGNAVTKLQTVKQLIYAKLAPAFPYAAVPVINSKGQTGTIPASQLQDAIKQGYQVQ